jgi:putative hydrolase of the HAD superfamily
MSLEAIFFDVGGTIVLANYDRTLEPLMARGVRPTGAELAAAEKAAKSRLDSQILQQGKISVDNGYWDNYYTALLQTLGLDDAELKSDLIARTRTSANWNRLADGAEATLRELGRKYRLGIISNSDGRIDELLRQLGILDLFACVTDSGIVGHEKPDSRIFISATQSMGVSTQEAAYVGDIYSVDYLGAMSVGMRAILMDAAGVYSDRPVERIDRIQELLKILR